MFHHFNGHLKLKRILQVRVSLYIQAYLGILAPAFLPSAHDLHTSIAKSANLTALGLVLVSFIQWRSSGSLSLSDALIVIYLSYITATSGIFGYNSPGSTSLLRKAMGLDDILAVTLGLLFNQIGSIFGVIVWALAETFGLAALSGVCKNNDGIRYVGWNMHPISATSLKMRVPFLILNSLALTFNTIAIVMGLSRAWKGIRSGKVLVVREGSGKVKKECRVERYFRAFLGVVFCTFWSVSVELVISWNRLRDQANIWTLGQMLSMLMLIQPLLDVAAAVYNAIAECRDKYPEDVIDENDLIERSERLARKMLVLMIEYAQPTSSSTPANRRIILTNSEEQMVAAAVGELRTPLIGAEGEVTFSPNEPRDAMSMSGIEEVIEAYDRYGVIVVKSLTFLNTSNEAANSNSNRGVLRWRALDTASDPCECPHIKADTMQEPDV
ncbi:hypothetical protein M422DRAFT_255480 [Sphaerobolus stellatus SS14]|uniref:Uncharacterized protein n=1 Tax=Sphaerobolus stellatus (strain SS14) TaxID=990650 RepID=A0A0C9VTS5_SPHS4|nr:hypothetical protein M422DRAFT_255480 [Sphaerobolus stellatus SS14]